MQIRLEITEEELKDLQERYAKLKAEGSVRLSFAEWAGREIASRFSEARSQKAEWAVQATLRPWFTREIERQLQMRDGKVWDGIDLRGFELTHRNDLCFTYLAILRVRINSYVKLLLCTRLWDGLPSQVDFENIIFVPVQ